MRRVAQAAFFQNPPTLPEVDAVIRFSNTHILHFVLKQFLSKVVKQPAEC